MANAYLDQQEKVRVLALGRGALTLFDVMLLDVDTLAASHRQLSAVRTTAGRKSELTILRLLLRRLAGQTLRMGDHAWLLWLMS